MMKSSKEETGVCLYPSVSPALKQLLTNHTLATVTSCAHFGKLSASNDAYAVCLWDLQVRHAISKEFREWCNIFSLPKAKNSRGEMSDLDIKQCGRPHSQLNPSKITTNYYVCSKVRC